MRDPKFSHFGTIPVCVGHTDRQTHYDGIYCASIALRGKNLTITNGHIVNVIVHNRGVQHDTET